MLIAFCRNQCCSHFGVFPQEAGSEETQLLRQPLASHKLASYSGWGARCLLPWTPRPPMCVVTQVLYSLPWLFPLFVFCFRKNTGVPWHASGRDLALSVAQVQSVVQELRSPSCAAQPRASGSSALRCAHRSSQ